MSTPARPTAAQASPLPPRSAAPSAVPPVASSSKPGSIRPSAPPLAPDNPEDDPLLRPLRQKYSTGELNEGANLAFNFDHEGDQNDGFEHGDEANDQSQRELSDDSAEWEVGDPDAGGRGIRSEACRPNPAGCLATDDAALCLQPRRQNAQGSRRRSVRGRISRRDRRAGLQSAGKPIVGGSFSACSRSSSLATP